MKESFVDRWTESLVEVLDASLVPACRFFLDPLHEGLNAVPPIGWRIAACTLLAVGSLWTVFLRRSVWVGAPSKSLVCDLRLWACLVALPYLFVYWFLF